MATDLARSEKRYGVATLFSLIALGGALLLFLEAGSPSSGWGFALAMAGAALAVAVLHWPNQ